MQKLRRNITYYLIRLLRIRKGNHQIALGCIIGFYPCWFPTFGVGPALSIALSKWVRGNMPAAIISASVGSLVWPVLFYLNYKIGYLIRSLYMSRVVRMDEIKDSNVPEVDYIETVEHLSKWESVGIDFLAGALLNSLFFSVVGYFIIRVALSKYRVRILRKLQ